MQILRHQEISEGLTEGFRVYLAGNLGKPQPLPHCIPSAGVEIGLSRYQEFTPETPHFHSENTEYNYVIKGQVKILYIETMTEFLFTAGDLFVMEVGNRYVTKAQAGAEVIFFKAPGGNDKQVVPSSGQVKVWLESWEAKVTD